MEDPADTLQMLEDEIETMRRVYVDEQPTLSVLIIARKTIEELAYPTKREAKTDKMRTDHAPEGEE